MGNPKRSALQVLWKGLMLGISLHRQIGNAPGDKATPRGLGQNIMMGFLGDEAKLEHHFQLRSFSMFSCMIDSESGQLVVHKYFPT